MLGACDGASCALHQHDRVAHADDAAPMRERSARRVRTAVRHQRQHGPDGAARPPAAGPQHPRLREPTRSRGLNRTPRAEATGPSSPSISTRFATSNGASRRPRSRTPESSRSSISRRESRATMPSTPSCMMDLLALAYQTDLTRISTFMLAREVSGRAYPEIGVSDSHHPLVASPGRAGQARTAAQDQRVPLPAVCASGREAGARRRRATGRCWTTRCSCTAPASATATRTSTTICRSR